MNSDDMNAQESHSDDGSAPRPEPDSRTPRRPSASPGNVSGATPPPSVAPVRRSKRWWVAGAAAAVLLVGVAVSAYAVARSDDDREPYQVTNGHLEIGTETHGEWRGLPSIDATPAVTPGTTMRIGGDVAVTYIGHVYDNHADLDIEDQSGAGRTVRIESIKTSIPSGFVVITTSDGTVVGTAPVSSGSQPVTVTLSTPLTSAGKNELVGTLWADNGDGKFDWKTDAVVIESDGDHDADDDSHDEWVTEDFDYWVK